MQITQFSVAIVTVYPHKVPGGYESLVLDCVAPQSFGNRLKVSWHNGHSIFDYIDTEGITETNCEGILIPNVFNV